MKSSIGPIPDDLAAKMLGQSAPPPAESVSEKAFQATVVALAKRNGWLCYHSFDSRKSQAGFPDLCLVRGSWLLFLELKSMDGKVSAAQHTWAEALMQVRGNVFCLTFRPNQWAAITELLTRPDTRG